MKTFLPRSSLHESADQRTALEAYEITVNGDNPEDLFLVKNHQEPSIPSILTYISLCQRSTETEVNDEEFVQSEKKADRVTKNLPEKLSRPMLPNGQTESGKNLMRMMLEMLEVLWIE